MTSGNSLVLCRYIGATSYTLGGIPVSCKVKRVGTTTSQGQTQTRSATQTSTDFYYEIKMQLKMQVLADYITNMCMISAEGELPIHNLYVDDGIEQVGYTGCQVDKCKITVDRTHAVIANITVIATGKEEKSLEVTDETEAPMAKSAVTALTVGGAAITKWIEFNFAVDNHIGTQGSGTGDAVDSWAGEATYSGTIKFIKTTTMLYHVDESVHDIVITLTDNQGSPVATTFTFGNCKSSGDEYGSEELGLFFEELNWDSAELVIS